MKETGRDRKFYGRSCISCKKLDKLELADILASSSPLTTQLSSLATLCASASSPSMVTAHSLVKCPAEATAANSGSKYNDRIFDFDLRSFFNNTRRQQNQSGTITPRIYLPAALVAALQCLLQIAAGFSLSNNTHT